MNLKQIIELAESKGISKVACKHCSDGFRECYSHIQRGICFHCGGSGEVANKWGKIKESAQALQASIEYSAQQFSKEEKAILKEDSSDRFKQRSLARLEVRKARARKQIKESINKLVEEVAKARG